MTNMPAPTVLLPMVRVPATRRVWLVAAHGGAGCTTIYREAGDMAPDEAVWADAGRALPVSADPAHPSMLLLCARGTSRGLESLRGLLADWHDGRFAGCRLLGVAVTAPCARAPRVLRRATALVGSGAPELYTLPFIRGLEVDGFPSRWPAAYRRMRERVAARARDVWSAPPAGSAHDGQVGAPGAGGVPENSNASVPDGTREEGTTHVR